METFARIDPGLRLVPRASGCSQPRGRRSGRIVSSARRQADRSQAQQNKESRAHTSLSIVYLLGEARLTLRAVELENRSLHRVAADLTIRGTTHAVTLYARVWRLSEDEVSAEARFAVERHRWGVSYRGSTVKDDLVDDQFWLDLAVYARAKSARL